jgi:hypothetical protein
MGQRDLHGGRRGEDVRCPVIPEAAAGGYPGAIYP